MYKITKDTVQNKKTNSLKENQRVGNKSSNNQALAETLALHQTLGNQAVLKLLSGTIQKKLKIGTSNDRYEQEADRIAEKIMTMPASNCTTCEEKETLQPQLADEISPFIQRQEYEEEEEEEEEETLQAKRTGRSETKLNTNIENRIFRTIGRGNSLDNYTRAFFESKFGYDFSRVRIHYDAESARLARQLNAEAFTYGRDIYFGAGRYNPNTFSGKRLLAHELTHVVQQRKSYQNLTIFRFVKRERYKIGELDEAIDSAKRVAKKTGLLGLMRWGRFTAAMGGYGLIEARLGPKIGSTKIIPDPRYIYTCGCGLIDLRHFYQLMYIAVVTTERFAVKKGIEHEIVAEASSRFAPEDITSNALGAEFGSHRSWFQRQSTFVSDLRNFLNRCKPVKWHSLTEKQRDCIVGWYAVDVGGDKHRRKTAGSDADPCNICQGTSFFPFKIDTKGRRIIGKKSRTKNIKSEEFKCLNICPPGIEGEIEFLKEIIETLPPLSSPERDYYEKQLSWREKLFAECSQICPTVCSRRDKIDKLKIEAMWLRGRIFDLSMNLANFEPISSHLRIEWDNERNRLRENLINILTTLSTLLEEEIKEIEKFLNFCPIDAYKEYPSEYVSDYNLLIQYENELVEIRNELQPLYRWRARRKINAIIEEIKEIEIWLSLLPQVCSPDYPDTEKLLSRKHKLELEQKRLVAFLTGEIVEYEQWDPRWGAKRYGKDPRCTSIRRAGCGPTSLAIVLNYLFLEDPELAGASGKMEIVTPPETVRYAETHGRVCNSGTKGDTMINNISTGWPGFEGRKVTLDEATNLLRQAYPIIFLCKRCRGKTRTGRSVTYPGHFMVLRSVDDLGAIYYVLDPGRREERDMETISRRELKRHARGFWWVHPR